MKRTPRLGVQIDGRQAITTKYLGPTNARGSRVKATAAAGSVTLEWDDALNVEENHTLAAEALMARMGWKATLYRGGLPGGGYCFVQVCHD